MFWDWYEVLFKCVEDYGMYCFLFFFDLIVVEFFEGLNVLVYKIVLFEFVDILFICRVVVKNKLMIMFIGIVNFVEIEEVCVVVCGIEVGFVLFYCILVYLVKFEDMCL